MTAFVILHYRAIDTTRSCVKSIRALAGDKHIVIVDNASPDGTGKQLAEEFAASPDVTVLLHDKNDGFARGNNVGVRWVCAHLDADFTVVLNNDVEIPQHDFIPQIARIYAQHPFDLLGPDIVSVFSGIHQSPKTLHGSCVIFSQRYLARHPEPFYAKTFMYYEMEILDWLCRQEGSVVRYDPSISVLHYQYVASKMEYRSIVRRSKFVIDCLLDSLDAAEELILASEPAKTEPHQPVSAVALADA